MHVSTAAPYAALSFCVALCLTGSANAHHALRAPTPRIAGDSPGSSIKSAPCGQSPNLRTESVTVYEPGSTITVEWDETIDHPSYYRIAFDADGDDNFPTRNTAQREGETDRPEDDFPVGDVVLKYIREEPNASSYSTQVTLPDIECENCTLQLIQFMYDRPSAPYYYQCADIALRRADSERSTGGASATDNQGQAGDGSSGDDAPNDDSAQSTAPAPNNELDRNGSDEGAALKSEESCELSAPNGERPLFNLASLALLMAGAAFRRRR